MKSDAQKDSGEKVLSCEALAQVIATERTSGSRIVLCFGTYQVIHAGHLHRISMAKRRGDLVVILVAADRFFDRESGPVINESIRAENIAGVGGVDYVGISQWPTAVEAIRLFSPSVFIRADGYENIEGAGRSVKEEEDTAARFVGAVIEDSEVYQATNLSSIGDPLAELPHEVLQFLKNFRRQHSSAEILDALEELTSLRVMVIGEAIIDEYVYGDTLGKSAKEPIIALRYISSEKHAGGSVIIANHLSDFSSRIDLVTYLGVENNQEAFIRENLKSNVHLHFVAKSLSPTIVKRRYVEKYLVSKLLEVYEINDDYLNSEEESQLCEILTPLLETCDVVIVADYGHGLISPAIIDILCKKAKFLAVNTQINAANNGYHTISRFARADYVCLHEGEVRLDQRDRSSDLQLLVERLAGRLGCQSVMVTRGKHGSLMFNRKSGFHACPAFALKLVDRVGAGDSVLAISSLCAARDLQPEMTSFISNMVGAQAVSIVGNRSPIKKQGLVRSIESILR
jgi:rfaE bifunctional protein kinase chain/domain